MSDKPFLYSVESALISKLPNDAVERFCTGVGSDKEHPSKALRVLMKELSLQDIPPDLLFDLIEKAYEGVYLAGHTSEIIDSGYPNKNADMNDKEFDKRISKAWEETLNPPSLD